MCPATPVGFVHYTVQLKPIGSMGSKIKVADGWRKIRHCLIRIDVTYGHSQEEMET